MLFCAKQVKQLLKINVHNPTNSRGSACVKARPCVCIWLRAGGWSMCFTLFTFLQDCVKLCLCFALELNCWEIRKYYFWCTVLFSEERKLEKWKSQEHTHKDVTSYCLLLFLVLCSPVIFVILAVFNQYLNLRLFVCLVLFVLSDFNSIQFCQITIKLSEGTLQCEVLNLTEL